MNIEQVLAVLSLLLSAATWILLILYLLDKKGKRIKFHYHKQVWLQNFWWGQVFRFYRLNGASNGLGVVILANEFSIALIKGEK